MKYLCLQTCQVRVGKRPMLVNSGMVVDLPEDPGARFRCLEDEEAPHEVDFTKATEQELTAAKWDFKAARLAIYEAYGVELKLEEGDKKSDIIAQILDAKFRAVNPTIINVPK